MASLFLDEAIARGLGPDSSLTDQLQHDITSGKRQLFTTQPRQHKLRPVVAEFGHKVRLAVRFSSSALFSLPAGFPKGSKILARHLERGFDRDVFLAKAGAQVAGPLVNGDSFEVITIGIPWEPQQFIEEAIRIGHPRFLLARVHQDTSQAIDRLLCSAPKLTGERANFLKRWSNRAVELKDDEMALHRSLPEHLQTVLKGKRLLLWKEILEDLSYSDVKVVDEIIKGFPMTGWSEKSGVFEGSVSA